MTRDEIIRMAREAGFEINKGQYHGMDADSYLYIWCDGGYLDEELERFAALVSAAEREACARAASIALLGADKSLSDRVLNAIRSRGQRE